MKNFFISFLVLLMIGFVISSCEKLAPDAEEQVSDKPVSTLDADRIVRKAVGDLLRTITVPVPSPSCCGIGIAVDCQDPVNMYYTNTWSAFLHKMDALGNPLGSIALTDVVTGASVSFGAISWDESRQKIWGGTDSSNPPKVYLIDPVTGDCREKFTMQNVWIGFCDGIAFDGTDNSLWVTDDVSYNVEHYDVTNVTASGGGEANFIGTIIPQGLYGSNLGAISGVQVGLGDLLYLGQNGRGQIVKVTKTGAYLGVFATATGRDEDLECDLITFAPLEVLWSKDAYNNRVEAFEVEPGTCVCGGGGALEVPLDIHPTSCPNPINTNARGKTPAAILGTADFDVTQIDVSTVKLMGVSPVNSAMEDVATPFEPFIGKIDCSNDCNTYAADGNMDLTLKFDTQELVAALGEISDGDCLVLSITGNLLDGTEFIGEDVVIIKMQN